MHQFERSQINIGSGASTRSITITSWYDTEKEHWRASAPAFLHLLAVPPPPSTAATEREACQTDRSDPGSGATRDKAILAVRNLLARRLVPQAAAAGTAGTGGDPRPARRG